jgi:dienelactone hydrolase
MGAEAIRRPFLACALALGALTACAGQPRTLDEAADRLAPHVSVTWPDGTDEPVPAVLMFSGCGGVRQVQDDYAQIIAGAGAAAMVVDSHAARSIPSALARPLVCTAALMRGQGRAADVFAAVQLARRDARIDPDRIVLLGWSHGGWAVMEALAFAAEATPPPGLEGSGEDALSGVRGAALIYPYCGWPGRARSRDDVWAVPVAALLVEGDVVAAPGDCEAVFERQAEAGAAIAVLTETGLTHAFDAPDQPRDPRMEYDADGAERARGWFAARMAGWLEDAR